MLLTKLKKVRNELVGNKYMKKVHFNNGLLQEYLYSHYEIGV